jgi:hypothetical protein
MFVIGILVLLTATGVIALARRSPRGITVTVWIVGGAYAIFGVGTGVVLFAHGGALGLAALSSGLAAATGVVIHRRRPMLGAGSLMAGGFAIAAGIGLVSAGLTAWGDSSTRTVIVAGLVAALIAFAPALLTGVALIRGPKRPLEEARP